MEEGRRKKMRKSEEGRENEEVMNKERMRKENKEE